MLEHFEFMEVLTSERMNLIVDAINGITGTLCVEYSDGHIKKSGSEDILTYDDLRETLDKGNLVILKYDNAILIPAFLNSDSGLDAIAFQSTYELGEVTNFKLVVTSLNEIIIESNDLAKLKIVTSVTEEFSESQRYSEFDIIKYHGQLILFNDTHEPGPLTEGDYSVINLEILGQSIMMLYEMLGFALNMMQDEITALESRVENLENDGYSISLTQYDTTDTNGKVTPKGSSTDPSGKVVGLSSNKSIYRKFYSDLFKVIQIANIVNEDTFHFKVSSRYSKYSGFIRVGLDSSGSTMYAYTDSPDIARNFMILGNSAIAIRVGGTGLEVTLETSSDIPLTNYIVNKDDYEVRYIESLYEHDDIGGNLVEVPDSVYVFNGHSNFESGTDGVDTGYFREFDGVIFTGTSPVRTIEDVSSVSELNNIESWRLYNNSEVPITEINIEFNGETVFTITEEVPINAYLEVTKVDYVWDSILILPPEDNVTVTYPIKKVGSSVKYNLSLETEDTVPDEGGDGVPTLTAVDKARRASLTSTVELGGVKVGDEFDNEKIQTILTQLLSPTVFPKLIGYTEPNLILYGKPTTLKVIVEASRGSSDLAYFTIGASRFPINAELSEASMKDYLTKTPTTSLDEVIEIPISVSDVDGNIVSDTASAKAVGGVFLFFSGLESISGDTELDFTEHNCQSARLTPDGSYTVNHSNLEYFYVVVPDTDEMEISEITSGGCLVPMNRSIKYTLKQGSAYLYMKVYRSTEKFNPGTFNFVIKSKLNS